MLPPFSSIQSHSSLMGPHPSTPRIFLVFIACFCICLGTIPLTLAGTDQPECGLNLCYGPPQVAGRICEASEPLINFARVTYRVTPIKDLYFNKDAFNNNESNSNVCCEGRGTVKGREVWIPLACSPDPYSKIIHFDGVISFPAIRCTGSPNGVFVLWSY